MDRFITALTRTEGVTAAELERIDARVMAEIDRATDEAESSPPPEQRDGLIGVYANPPAAPVLWYREGVRSAVEKHERAQGWGTHDDA
jgi:TPP-dependent pyruvate/acetoin dehydrogenase alpha subunit